MLAEISVQFAWKFCYSDSLSCKCREALSDCLANTLETCRRERERGFGCKHSWRRPGPRAAPRSAGLRSQAASVCLGAPPPRAVGTGCCSGPNPWHCDLIRRGLGHVLIPGQVRGGESIHTGQVHLQGKAVPDPTSATAWRELAPASCWLAGSAGPRHNRHCSTSQPAGDPCGQGLGLS